MHKTSKGLDSFKVEYVANDDFHSREIFATSLKQAMISAHSQLQQEFGWNFIIRSIKKN